MNQSTKELNRAGELPGRNLREVGNKKSRLGGVQRSTRVLQIVRKSTPGILLREGRTASTTGRKVFVLGKGREIGGRNFEKLRGKGLKIRHKTR